MGSEQAEVCTCPHCTMESDGACATKDARAASQHGPTGNPFPPQTEVVRESGWTVSVDGSPVAWFKYPGHASKWANVNHHDRCKIIPSESPATKRGEEAKPNPPAWATPQILAACKPGERLYYWPVQQMVRAYPSRQRWIAGVLGCQALAPESTAASEDECYTIPTPPPDKPKPEAKCDGSGRVENVPTFGQYAGAWTVCPGCPACKPKPDDAEEVARKIVYDWNQTDHNAYSEGLLTDNELAALEARITAAIRADRQKHAPAYRRPRVFCLACERGQEDGHYSHCEHSEFAGKVRELCQHAINVAMPGTWTYSAAREVLAMMEQR